MRKQLVQRPLRLTISAVRTHTLNLLEDNDILGDASSETHQFTELTIPPHPGLRWADVLHALRVYEFESHLTEVLPGADGSITLSRSIAGDMERSILQVRTLSEKSAFLLAAEPTTVEQINEAVAGLRSEKGGWEDVVCRPIRQEDGSRGFEITNVTSTEVVVSGGTDTSHTVASLTALAAEKFPDLAPEEVYFSPIEAENASASADEDPTDICMRGCPMDAAIDRVPLVVDEDTSGQITIACDVDTSENTLRNGVSLAEMTAVALRVFPDVSPHHLGVEFGYMRDDVSITVDAS